MTHDVEYYFYFLANLKIEVNGIKEYIANKSMTTLPVIYNQSLLSFANQHIPDPMRYAMFAARAQIKVDEIQQIIQFQVSEEELSERIEELLSFANRRSTASPIRFMMVLQQVIDELLQEKEESKQRSHQRCALIKEEIMMKAWHPKRVEQLIELGYDVEDM